MPLKSRHNSRSFAVFTAVIILGSGLVALAEHEDEQERENHARIGRGKTVALPPPAARSGVTYAADIKPILDSSCADCHSGSHAKARLRLDSLENALKGGEEGKVILPGNSAKSRLVLSVVHATRDREGWMPPLHNKEGIKPLVPEEIGLIRAWIDQGAK